jgi:hypothetical protein
MPSLDRGEGIGLYSKWVTRGYLRPRDEDSTIELLNRIASEHGAQFLLAIAERDLLVIRAAADAGRLVGLQAPVPAAAQLAVVLDKSATYDRDAILIEDGTAQYHQIRSFIPFSSIRAIAIPRETETKGRSISLSAPSSLIAEIGVVVNSFSCCFRNLSTALRRPWLARRRRRMAYRKSVFLMYSWGCVRMSTGES